MKIIKDEEMNFVFLKTSIGTDGFVNDYLEGKLTRLREEIRRLSDMTHLHECFTLLRSCASACKVTHLMRTIPPKQLSNFLNGFDDELRRAMEKILGHDLNDKDWLICQLPAKYGGFGLRSGKLTAGAQHVMSLQKCSPAMAAHAKDWCLKECAKRSSEGWLKDHIGSNFDLDAYISDLGPTSDQLLTSENKTYSLSLPQRCEHACYIRMLESLSDKERLRLISNSGPTQK